MISVKNPQAHSKSALFLTTVYSDMDTTLAKLVQAEVGGNAEVLPKHDLIHHVHDSARLRPRRHGHDG